MDVKICEKCGRIFQSSFGSDVCPQCENVFDDDYHKVRDYLYDHPGAAEQEIRKEFPDVTHKDIMNWLRSGKLSIADSSKVRLTCEQCGKVIREGYYCEECQRIVDRIRARAQGKKEQHSIQKGVAVTTPSQTAEDSKMRFLNKNE